MELKAKDGGAIVACVQSSVQNGKSVEVPAVSYVAVGIAAAALALSGLGAASAAGHPGSSTPSPTFGEVIGWFQGMAMNGMFSVQYPGIYRSFTKNFAFSTGLIPWSGMQTSIDNFRKSTGGNLTDDSYSFLKNATLVYPDGSSANTTSNIAKRGWELVARAIDTSVNGTSTGSSAGSASGQHSHLVQGIQGFVEQLTIPQANSFMTVLLIFAIVVVAIVVGILLFKVVLEAWALFASFPKNLTTFRKEYWMVMARTIVNLILVLYGVWVLYCIFQFTHGDSWAAKLLASITLGIFTAILGYYTVRIWMISRHFKKLQGDNGVLYEDKELWKRYKLFYADYKRGRWWLFMPAIVYMFAKGCVLAAGDGHGLVQTIGQLILEALMLILLLWSRPYNLKSGNWINIVIQVVRALSVVCILVFVEELGISQTTKTITGVVLIAVQSALTGVLAILIAVNSLIFCIKDNPHRKRRKEAEKLNRDLDNLTPLDNRESILMEPQPYKFSPPKHQRDLSGVTLNNPAYEPFRGQGGEKSRLSTRREDSSDFLVSSAASMGKQNERTVSRGSASYRSVSPAPAEREPTLPRVGYGRAL
jgi:Transient receptor potential (TRP) ion channel